MDDGESPSPWESPGRRLLDALLNAAVSNQINTNFEGDFTEQL